MITHHRTRWQCFATQHKPLIYDSPEMFEDHMKADHAGSFPLDKLPFIVEMSAQPITPTLEHCPFCSETAGNVEEHVGQHLREFALHSLPWLDYAEGESQDGSSWQSNGTRSTEGTPETVGEAQDLPPPVFSDYATKSKPRRKSRLRSYGHLPEIAAQHEPHLIFELLDDKMIEAFACTQYQVDSVETLVQLLCSQGVDIEAKDQVGRTPLLRASKNGQEAVVKLLFQQHANVETEDQIGRTPLSWAAQNGHKAVVHLLLQQGANVERKDQIGRTPLSWAAQNGQEAIIHLLLQQGANVQAEDQAGRTPLSWAAENGQEAVVHLLLQQGANVETEDRAGCTPLSWAAQNGQEAVVHLLIQQGAIVEREDQIGRTPLSWAAQNGQVAVVQLLLQQGANAQAEDQAGWTPLSWAAENGQEAVVHLLLQQGANVETEDQADPTPFFFVPSRRDPDFVGRERLLDEIHEKCSTPPSMIALVGLGGVG
jgi:ankyrin repeat protein